MKRSASGGRQTERAQEGELDYSHFNFCLELQFVVFNSAVV